MAKINVLTKDVYNRISAGEVVERPASIVKEMFENSVDAKAKNITVSIENGGINSICIEDDGCGVEKEELNKVFLPHATSKLSSAKELDSISSLGFRGEAMSSIASVSKVKFVSKTEGEEVGSFISIEGGSVVDSGEEQREIGSKVTVSAIFYNTPARLKFLKTPKSEESEVTTLMEKLILANPNVAVKYYVNGKMIFQSFGDGLKNALISIYSKSIIDNTLEISTEKNGILIQGFLGNINFPKANKTYQTLIVNGRYVTDNTVSSAIHNAYSTYLMKRQYPFYVLSLTLAPEFVDVNVHPRKSEIRFQNNQIVYGSVYSVVSKVIDGTSQSLEIIKNVSSAFELNEETQENKANEPNLFDDIKKLDSEALNALTSKVKQNFSADFEEKDKFVLPIKQEKFGLQNNDLQNSFIQKKYIDDNGKVVYKPYDKTVYDGQRTANVCDHVSQIDFEVPHVEPEKNNALDDMFAENKQYIAELEQKTVKQESVEVEENLTLIGQIFDTYLIFEQGSNVYLVDQHAAHERILFDKLVEEVKTNKITRQPLLIPYCVTVNAREFDILDGLIDFIKEIGIDIEIYGDNSFRIYSVPVGFEDINIEKFIIDIVNDAKFKDEKIPTVIREKLMQKACKSAIKAGDKLSLSEVDSLMAQLKSNFGLKCPHGRPVAVKLTRTEVDKWFKRIL